jgi:hypothetical protein
MKNLKILLLGLLVAFISVSSANAQTFQEKVVDEYASLEYDCDGVYGEVVGSVTTHWLYHFDNEGNLDWFQVSVNADGLINYETGEEFKLSYVGKSDVEDLVQSWHYNLLGDKGTHLIYSVTMEYDLELGWWVIVDEKTKCL